MVSALTAPVMTMRYSMTCEVMSPPQSAFVQALAGQVY